MPHAAVLLVLAVLTPLATVAATNHSLPGGRHSCGTQGRYAPNGTYEANLRRVAARLTVKLVNASSPRTASAYADAHQVVASAYCRWTPDDFNSSSARCVACVALAFRDAHLLCPYHRDATVERAECRVAYHDAQLMERRDMGAMVVDDRTMSSRWKRVLVQDFPLILYFQAIGLACLFFLLLQEWRGRRRGPAMQLVV